MARCLSPTLWCDSQLPSVLFLLQSAARQHYGFLEVPVSLLAGRFITDSVGQGFWLQHDTLMCRAGAIHGLQLYAAVVGFCLLFAGSCCAQEVDPVFDP